MPILQQPSYCLFWAHQWWPFGDPWWLCMDTQNWAAWVQAFGSILAILGSAWIGWWLHKMQVRAERIRLVEAHIGEVRRTASLLRYAALKIGNMATRMSSVDELAAYFDDIGHHDFIPQLHRGMECLGEKDAPTAFTLMLLIGAKEAFDHFHQVFRQGRLAKGDDEFLATRRARVLKLLNVVELAADEFDRYIAEEQARAGL